jgi:hypothetical protein
MPGWSCRDGVSLIPEESITNCRLDHLVGAVFFVSARFAFIRVDIKRIQSTRIVGKGYYSADHGQSSATSKQNLFQWGVFK